MRVTLELQLYVPAPLAEPVPAGETLVLIVSVHIVVALTGPA